MTHEPDPKNVTELRKQLRHRRVHVAVPMGSTTALAEITVEEAVRLWRLAGAVLGPRRVYLNTDDHLQRDLAVLAFKDWWSSPPRFEIGPDGRARGVQSEVDDG